MKRLVTPFLLLALGAGLAQAQQDETPPAEMDAVAKKTMDAFLAQEYNLGKEGVKKASFKMTAKLEGPALGGQVMNSGAAFNWDGKKGALKWDNPQVGGILERQGWKAKRFGGLYDPLDSVRELAGCKLTGKEDEKGTYLTISGHKDGIVGYRFDKEGNMKTVFMAQKNPQTGQETKLEFTVKGVAIGDKRVIGGWDFEVEMQGVKIKSSVTFTYQKVGSYHALQSITEKMDRAGSPFFKLTMNFSDHKFNGDVGGATELPTPR